MGTGSDARQPTSTGRMDGAALQRGGVEINSRRSHRPDSSDSLLTVVHLVANSATQWTSVGATFFLVAPPFSFRIRRSRSRPGPAIEPRLRSVPAPSVAPPASP